MQFLFIDAVPKYLKFVTFSDDLLATVFCCDFVTVRFIAGVKVNIDIFCPRPK
jgi:hypothetical protein